MNSDRCYHIPTAPGQTICTCKDYQMFLETLIGLQARYIDTLETERFKHEPKEIDIGKIHG